MIKKKVTLFILMILNFSLIGCSSIINSRSDLQSDSVQSITYEDNTSNVNSCNDTSRIMQDVEYISREIDEIFGCEYEHSAFIKADIKNVYDNVLFKNRRCILLELDIEKDYYDRIDCDKIYLPIHPKIDILGKIDITDELVKIIKNRDSMYVKFEYNLANNHSIDQFQNLPDESISIASAFDILNYFEMILMKDKALANEEYFSLLFNNQTLLNRYYSESYNQELYEGRKEEELEILFENIVEKNLIKNNEE